MVKKPSILERLGVKWAVNLGLIMYSHIGPVDIMPNRS